MPTALNVPVSDKDDDKDKEDVITPNMKTKKQHAASTETTEEGTTKITPSSSSSTAEKQQKPKKASSQLSIKSFFRQPPVASAAKKSSTKHASKKNLFSSNKKAATEVHSSLVKSTTKATPSTAAASESSGKKKKKKKKIPSATTSASGASSLTNATKKTATPSKSPASAQQPSSSSSKRAATMQEEPTSEELRDIVLGCTSISTTTTSTNLDDDIVVLPTTNVRGGFSTSDNDDSLLPPMIRNPNTRLLKKPSTKNDNGRKEEECEKASTAKQEESLMVTDHENVQEKVAAAATSSSSSTLGEQKESDDQDSSLSKANESDEQNGKTTEQQKVQQQQQYDEKDEDDEDSVMQVDNEAIREVHGNENNKDDDGEQGPNDDDDDDSTLDTSPTKPSEMNANLTDSDVKSGNKVAADAPPVKAIGLEVVNKTAGKNDEGAMNRVDLTTTETEGVSVLVTTAPKQQSKSDATTLVATTKPTPMTKSSPAKLPAACAVEVSAERKAALKRNETLRVQYNARLAGLIERTREGLDEERYQLPAPCKVDSLPKEGTDESPSPPMEFPECAIPSLSLLIQDSQLPLADLVATSLIQLKEAFSDGVHFHQEGIEAKIKLLATREPYVQIDNNSRSINKFEDDNQDRMWRWEVVSLHLLPDAFASKIKKARTARRKVRSHSKALCTLLKYLDQADALFQDPSSSQDKCDDLAAKISSAEEKVLKYERDEEKVRLAAETKREKEATKAKRLDDKQKEKARAAEQKQKEKEEREAKKRMQEEERQKEKLEKESKIKKQRTMMESFFTHTKSSPRKAQTVVVKTDMPVSSASAKSDAFWSSLNASDHPLRGPMFPSLSLKAVASRKRRTRVVPVQVFATVMPEEGAFDAQPYAELQTIRVPNKYKFLSFMEDCRPPYHGTWSKTSSIVTGQNPLQKDTRFLDYDVDSEAEWEEGDDEFGEDCEADGPDDDDNIVDEEGDTRKYNYQDGWLASDDDLGDEDDDIDEDTKLLRKKKLLQGSDSQEAAISVQPSVCIIAPGNGGVPSDVIGDDLEEGNERIEGVSPSIARDLLTSHTATVLSSECPCLDAFPPLLVEEGNLDASTPNGAGGGGKAASNEMSEADLITFVEFVHHCKLPSKDKVVEELRAAHSSITSSRAQATRKLDSIAEKKKHPAGGYYWEVKREVLEELGLNQLLNMKVEVSPNSEKKSSKISSGEISTPGLAKRKGPTSSDKSSKKKKVSSPTEGDAPDSATPSAREAAATSEKSSSKKKRAAPKVNEAAAKLFAGFLKKKKSEE